MVNLSKTLSDSTIRAFAEYIPIRIANTNAGSKFVLKAYVPIISKISSKDANTIEKIVRNVFLLRGDNQPSAEINLVIAKLKSLCGKSESHIRTELGALMTHFKK